MITDTYLHTNKSIVTEYLFNAMIVYLLACKASESELINMIVIEKHPINSGLCHYFNEVCDDIAMSDFIIKELAKDNLSGFDEPGYWYNAPWTVAINSLDSFEAFSTVSKSTLVKIKEESFKPRLENLKRTIKRLETELKTHNTSNHN